MNKDAVEKLKKNKSMRKKLPIIIGILAVIVVMGIGIVAALGGTTTISSNGTSLFPQGLNTSAINSNQWFNGFGANVSDTMNYPIGPATYIIYSNGTWTYAKNGTTGQIDYSGTNASLVVQQALNALPSGTTNPPALGGGTVLLEGLFNFGNTINITNCQGILIAGVEDRSTAINITSDVDCFNVSGFCLHIASNTI